MVALLSIFEQQCPQVRGYKKIKLILEQSIKDYEIRSMCQQPDLVNQGMKDK